MATLEVHDEAGRVQFIELNPEHPVLFGTSPTCDIPLGGDGILPVHGRIRWKKKRYKVEASPDAQFVLVNGRKMAESSLRQGDELTVGPCRIYMFRADDVEAARGGIPRPPRRPDEEATVQLDDPQRAAIALAGRTGPARPAAPGPAPAPPREKPAAAAPPPPTPRAKPMKPAQEPAPAAPEPSLLERFDLAEDLKSDPGVAEARPRSGTRRKAGDSRLGRWLQRLREGDERAPGEERLLSSPLVISLVVSLAVLIGLGIVLRTILVRTAATRTYNQATGLMQDGDYRTAIREFDEFLASYPDDPRAGTARVRRALANVRQYVTISGATWSSALEAAREMFDSVGALPAFRDDRVELAELVLRIGEGLADRARRGPDGKALAEAESAIPLHRSVAGEAADVQIRRSRLPELLSEARAKVQKAASRDEALAAMDRAILDGSASGVYQVRDRLVGRYGDLAQDPELLRRMNRANDLVRAAAKPAPGRWPVARSPRPDVLGPPTSLVLRSQAAAPPADAAANRPVVLALADGLACGIDAANGAPLWQVPVGLSSPFPPAAVPGDPSTLVFDARHNELVRLGSRDGRTIWRVALGEAVDGPPLVIGNQLYQVLPRGVVLVLSLESGEAQAALDLGMPATRSPVADEQGRSLYVLGRRDCLFVVGRDPFACVDVEYLGHEEGSIPCAPSRFGRFLIVAENHRSDDGRWRVFVLDSEGTKPRPVQEVPIAGWTWSPPPGSGSFLWATGDRGGVEVFSLGDYASKSPLRPVAALPPDGSSSGPAYGLAQSERELWLSAGRPARYELDAERGRLNARPLLSQAGPALGPIQVAGRALVLTFQDPQTGGSLIWAADATTGAEAWRTVLGAPWPSSPSAGRGGDGVSSVSGTGAEIRLDPGRLQSGGFVPLLLPPPGAPQAPPGETLEIELGAGGRLTVLVPDPPNGELWAREPGGSAPWKKLDLPAPAATAPLAWGGGLLVPASDGRAYLIDPADGRSLAEPLVPEYARERQGAWRPPAAVDAAAAILADDSGRIRRLGLTPSAGPQLSVLGEARLDSPIVAGPACTGEAVVVATADGKVRTLSVRDLSPIGAWPGMGSASGEVAAVGGLAFVADPAGGVLALGRDGRRLWSTTLPAPALGAPAVVGDSAWLLDRQGSLNELALADGKARRRVDLKLPPAGPLVPVGAKLAVPTGRGTLRLFDPASKPE